MIEHGAFDRVRVKQPDRMYGASLSKAIDTANALFESQRIPRQLDIDDQPAAMMQVQSFAGRIGRDEDVERGLR